MTDPQSDVRNMLTEIIGMAHNLRGYADTTLLDDEVLRSIRDAEMALAEADDEAESIELAIP